MQEFKSFLKSLTPLTAKMMNSFFKYVLGVEKTEPQDKREKKYSDRNTMFQQSLFILIVSFLYIYFGMFISTFENKAIVENLTEIKILFFLLTSFTTKYYTFDANPFFGNIDIDTYTKSNPKILSCPMGVINYPRKLKVIFYKGNPFYKVEMRDMNSNNRLEYAGYIDDTKMKSFFKVSYTWIMEIQGMTAIRAVLGVVLSSEILLFLVDVSSGTFHEDAHTLNKNFLIALLLAYIFFYLKSHTKNSRKNRYLEKSSLIREELKKAIAKVRRTKS